MTKWANEREDLIAQTMAFVRSVTGRKPEVAVEPLPIEPLPAELLRAQTPFSASFVPSTESTAPTDSPPTTMMLPLKALPQGDVRKEIESRVAAFQAHQHRFQREREAYFNSVLTQARSTTEGKSDAPPV